MFRRVASLVLATTLLWLPGGVAWGAGPASPFSFERNVDGVLLSEGDRKVYFFQLAAKSQDGKWPRANYIHPLYGLSGETLTEDFPKDHPHHRGVFWAWHQLKLDGQPLADPWICEGIRWLPPSDQDEGVVMRTGPHSARLEVTRHWAVEREGETLRVVEERLALTAQASSDQLRLLDFELRLRALLEGISIGGSDNAKGYGGFSARLRLTPGVRFVGKRGEVTPQTGPVDAGNWLNIVYPDGGATHVGLLCHPSHPRLEPFTPQWILRSQRSMQNVAWPGRKAVPLPTDEPVVLRYRMLLHRQGPLETSLARHWRRYRQLP